MATTSGEELDLTAVPMPADLALAGGADPSAFTDQYKQFSKEKWSGLSC